MPFIHPPRRVLGLLLGLLVPVTAHATPGQPAAGPPVDGLPPPAPPAVDVPDPNDPVDHLAILTGIARKKGRRLMRELRVREFDLPTAVAAVRRTERDGTEDLYVVYDVSLFNRCVFTDPPEGRDAMRARREDCSGERGIETKLAHVRIAPTPRGRAEDTGGALTFVGEPIELGQRAATAAQMATQAYFDGIGPIDAGPGSELRIWVAMTECEFEESNDARGPFERNQWFGQGSQHLRIYDDELEVDTDEVLVSGDFEAAVGAPTVSFEARTRILDVHSGSTQRRLRYLPDVDSFVPAT